MTGTPTPTGPAPTSSTTSLTASSRTATRTGPTPEVVPLAPRALRDAFGTFPSGVVAVAAQVDGVPVGIAASSFTSVSLDPPLVSLCVARTSGTWPLLRRADRLGVTVLAEHHDQACRRLAGPAGRRFDDLPVTCGDGGALTVDDGLARFETSLHHEVEAGDHWIAVLRVHHAEHRPGRPLVFHRSGFDRLAG